MKSIYFHRDLKHFNSLSAINTHYRVNFIRFWKVVKFVLLNILKYKFQIKNYLKEEIKKNEEIILSADILVMHIWTRSLQPLQYNCAWAGEVTQNSIYSCVYISKSGIYLVIFFLSYLLLLFCWFASVNIIYRHQTWISQSIVLLIIKKKIIRWPIYAEHPPPPRKRNNKLEYEISWLQCNIYES